jgi:hypothetical protein
MRTDGRIDRQTDMTNLTAAFHSIAKGPKTTVTCLQSKEVQNLFPVQRV